MEFARRREPHHAHAVAGVVQADAVREAGVEPRGFHHVVEKFADLPDAGVETGMLAVVVEQARVAFADEDHAAGRGSHDVVIPFEQCIHAFGERLGVALESRIGHRLSAAGLVERVVHVAAHAAEQFAGSASHFGVDGVDVTGDEQSDFHTLRFVFASRILGDTSKIAVFPGKCSPAAHSAAGMRIRKRGPHLAVRSPCGLCGRLLRGVGPYLISICRAAGVTCTSFFFGISTVSTPCSTLAAIFSFSTLSGRIRLCWNWL